jgi:hypothetical protein
MTAHLTNPKTGQHVILTPAKMTAKAAHIAALEKKTAAAEALNARLDAEKAEREATREHVKSVIAKQVWDTVLNGSDQTEGTLIVEVERGPTRLLARDGLAWLVAKGKLNAAQRMAGERYRVDFEALHGGSLRSCLNDTPGGRFASTEILPPLQFATAREALDRARRHGLASDNTLIWLCDEVAGKGATLRDIAAGDKHRAAALEIELSVALRLLARHYGFAS